jgi:hypothetical protein
MEEREGVVRAPDGGEPRSWKRAYERPRLTVVGTLRALTGGRHGVPTDGEYTAGSHPKGT